MGRREVSLPPHEVANLDAAHPDWEIVREGAASWLLLPGCLVPKGYNHAVVTVALRLEPGYPDTQIDMVYFHPELRRVDGKAIGATEGRMVVDGKHFQRWSRHRTSENAWRAGEDDIESHILLVKHWLEREFAWAIQT